MSFFGFDASAPPNPRHQHSPSPSHAYDFQDTYEGMGEFEEDDVLNSETFGEGEISKNFDFAASARGQPPVSAAQTRPNVSFARAAAAANDDDFMKDLWGDNTPENVSAAGARHGGDPGQHPGAKTAASSGERKVLSLQEIEAQLTAIDTSSGRPQGPPQPGFYPAMPAQYGGYMLPQGYLPPGGQFGMPYPGQYMHMQPPYPQMPPPQMAGGYAQVSRPPVLAGFAGNPGQNAPPQPPYDAVHVPEPQQQQPALKAPQNGPGAGQNVPADPVHGAPTNSGVSPPKSGPNAAARSDLSQFPMLGSKSAENADKDAYAPPQQPVQLQHRQHVRGHNPGHYVGQNPGQNPAPQSLSQEEQHRLARRQEKVAKIMRYSGVMNPKDKDFVTRFQLSQIVTEDPYNEDFYAQVYKVIHPKAAPTALGGIHASGGAPAAQEPNSIAQAYLDQSGHRLGGRFKRADVALQRMQQQVQKAVSVAKDRQKATRGVREGVLGKISVGSGKKPRQQLVILSKAAQKAKDNEQEEQENENKENSDSKNENQASEISKNAQHKASGPKKYTKKDIMGILEEIINNLMTVESESRSSPDVDTGKLWQSMHVTDQASSSGDDESSVNPFVQCLNYAKALKILPRLFKFLTGEQILSVVALVMANLENLTVIKHGSYTTYDSKQVPLEVARLVEAYTLTFCKVLMNAVQDFKFKQLLGLLRVLTQHNVVSFVSTTKIGLSVLTTLLSRAELMRGEGSISATDLSEWTSCYDELFTALESRIAAIFPPTHGDSEDDYVWQFLATLSLGGKLSHQRIIVEEVKDEIFGVMSRAKAIDNSDLANLYKKQNMMNNLNMYLVVMGLVADENEIQELQT